MRLSGQAHPNELAEECVRFGLPAEEEGEDGPWRGKWRYVERRIRHWKLPELLQLGREVATVYDDNRDLTTCSAPAECAAR